MNEKGCFLWLATGRVASSLKFQLHGSSDEEFVIQLDSCTQQMHTYVHCYRYSSPGRSTGVGGG